MKKFLSLLMILMLASSTAMAAEKKSSKSKDKKSTKKEAKKEVKKSEKKQTSNSGSERRGWVVQFQGGFNFLASATGPTTFTGVGIGGEITVAYAFNKNFSLGLLTGLESNDYKASGGYSGGWSYAPLEAVFQYDFDGSAHPFLFLGLGLANNSATNDVPLVTYNDSATETDLIFSPGVGLAFEVDAKTDFFVQARFDIMTLSSDWKADSGWQDGVFIPFQVGVNFSGI